MSKGDGLRAAAKQAAADDAATHGEVDVVGEPNITTTPHAQVVAVRVVMKGGADRNYEYRCDKNGENCKLWDV